MDKQTEKRDTVSPLQKLNKWIISKWSDPGKLIPCVEVSDKIDELLTTEKEYWLKEGADDYLGDKRKLLQAQFEIIGGYISKIDLDKLDIETVRDMLSHDYDFLHQEFTLLQAETLLSEKNKLTPSDEKISADALPYLMALVRVGYSQAAIEISEWSHDKNVSPDFIDQILAMLNSENKKKFTCELFVKELAEVEKEYANQFKATPETAADTPYEKNSDAVEFADWITGEIEYRKGLMVKSEDEYQMTWYKGQINILETVLRQLPFLPSLSTHEKFSSGAVEVIKGLVDTFGDLAKTNRQLDAIEEGRTFIIQLKPNKSK